MIAETPYDVRWTMFGIPCRIHPLFWLMAVAISWSWLELGMLHLVVAVLCVLVSILLHELGHVFAGLLFGSRGYIILWGMGGLAVGSSQLENRWQRIFVYAAGPLIQLLLYGLLRVLFPLLPVELWIPVPGQPVPLLATFFLVMLFVNLYWPLLNLLPIYPLDGGQIARDLFTAVSRDGVRQSLVMSIGLCGLLALYGFYVSGNPDRAIPWLPVGRGSAIFFLVFAALNVQLLMIENDRRNWTDDHRWQ